jgi:hypothetical protein
MKGYGMIADISILISVLALGFSFFVFFDSRRRDQRDIFLKMHELLISDDVLRCRYVLFQTVTDEDSIKRLTDSEWRDVNRAMATLNALGLYLENGYVKERDVMDIWARPICRVWKAAQPVIDYRERLQGYEPWKHFSFLAEKAQQYLDRTGDNVDLKVWRRANPPDALRSSDD